MNQLSPFMITKIFSRMKEDLREPHSKMIINIRQKKILQQRMKPDINTNVVESVMEWFWQRQLIMITIPHPLDLIRSFLPLLSQCGPKYAAVITQVH